MLKKITGLVLLAATWVIFLPSQGAAFNSDKKNNSISGLSTENLVLQQRRGRGNGGLWQGNSRRRNGRWYGYKNYGQYRRTQVGNRRYRTIRQTMWRNGRRITVTRRIIY